MPGVTFCDSRCEGLATTGTVAIELVQLDFLRGEGRLATSARIRILDGPRDSLRWSDSTWTSDQIAARSSPSGQADATLAMLRELAAVTAKKLCNPALQTRLCPSTTSDRQGRSGWCCTDLIGVEP
jgi:hypothetical protein